MVSTTSKVSSFLTLFYQILFKVTGSIIIMFVSKAWRPTEINRVREQMINTSSSSCNSLFIKLKSYKNQFLNVGNIKSNIRAYLNTNFGFLISVLTYNTLLIFLKYLSTNFQYCDRLQTLVLFWKFVSVRFSLI